MMKCCALVAALLFGCVATDEASLEAPITTDLGEEVSSGELHDGDFESEAHGDIIPETGDEPTDDGDNGDGDGGDAGPCTETDNGERVCPEPEGPTCATANGTVDLDSAPANVNDSDGKVTFCHATSSAVNPFVVITTSVKACKAHEEHTKLPKGGERDVFPTGGCAD